MKLAVITYAAPHLKTAQVVLNLARRDRRPAALFAAPFVQRKSRDVSFAHRPNQLVAPHTRDLARFAGAAYVPISEPNAIPRDYDLYLITGIGLLPEPFVSETLGRVINAHPGIIPFSRGLDSFKWSILDDVRLGNTLHFIDREADAGEVIAIEETPVFPSDTLESLAARHYEAEIRLLSEFDLYLDRPRPTIDMAAGGPPRMRMTPSVEAGLVQRFEAYREQFTAVPAGSDVSA